VGGGSYFFDSIGVLLSAPEEKRMAAKVAWKRIFNIAFLLGLCFTADCLPSFAQNPPKNLTLIYTNNIWGEIDPCPV